MHARRWTVLAIVAAFLIGFGMGGTTVHYAQAQGLFGLSTSVEQIGTALADMKKNVDALQQNMGTLTKIKEDLGALASGKNNPLLKEGESLKQEGEGLKKLVPGFGQ